MEVKSPDPQPRDDGEYDTYVNGVAYGKPYAKIYLDEDRALTLERITLGDARRLARAAVQVEQELAAAHAMMAAPHGSDHFYKGTCQLCGKAADDALHADPAEAADPGYLEDAAAQDDGEPLPQALITLACGCSFTGPQTSVKKVYCDTHGRHEPITSVTPYGTGEACPDCGQPMAAHATLDMARASAGPQAETVR
jgi:hypothetical protein